MPPSPWITRFAQTLPAGGTVLDLACGGGRHTTYLLEHGHHVTAVDRDLSGVRDLSSDRLRLVQADLEDGSPWPLGDENFAAVVVTNYLWRPLFPSIVGSLAPGGTLLYETFGVGNERFGKPSNPKFLLRPGELLETLGSDLRIVAFEDGEVRAPKPAVVQRICAVKTTDVPPLPPSRS